MGVFQEKYGFFNEEEENESLLPRNNPFLKNNSNAYFVFD
jgi:hypothetical protein